MDNKIGVVMHTYCPANGFRKLLFSLKLIRKGKTKIPKRGIIACRQAILVAKRFNAPLILSVGKTIPWETASEAEIYARDYIRKLAPDISLIIGDDPNVRDTASEISHSFKVCRKNDFNIVIVVALKPQITFRMKGYWDIIKTSEMLVGYFPPEETPWQYWPWEFGMMILEKIMPPNSRMRRFALTLVGRKG